MVYMQHSKCCGSNPMSVRVRPPAPRTIYMTKNKLQFEWNANLAYAIGLLATDGSLSKDGRHIILVSTDYQILENFQKCLPFNTKITNKLPGEYSKKQTYKVQFSNVQFYNWLLTIGLFPNKTYTINSIKIPNQYFRDFLRGHLDGDGDVVTYLDTSNTSKNPHYKYMRIYTRFCSASKEHIFWIQNTIYNLIQIKGSIHEWTKKDNPTAQWRLRFAKKDSLRLYKWMYYNSDILCLDRKKEKFDLFYSCLISNDIHGKIDV